MFSVQYRNIYICAYIYNMKCILYVYIYIPILSSHVTIDGNGMIFGKSKTSIFGADVHFLAWSPALSADPEFL